MINTSKKVRVAILAIATITLTALVATSGTAVLMKPVLAQTVSSSAGGATATYGGVDIDTSKGTYTCNGGGQKPTDGLTVDAYKRHGILTGHWTLVNAQSSGQDSTGIITGGQVSTSTYKLTGKQVKEFTCPTIYDKIVISGKCGNGVIIEMTSGDTGKKITSLKGNARCSAS
jgi:hypothetical protein